MSLSLKTLLDLSLLIKNSLDSLFSAYSTPFNSTKNTLPNAPTPNYLIILKSSTLATRLLEILEFDFDKDDNALFELLGFSTESFDLAFLLQMGHVLSLSFAE